MTLLRVLKAIFNVALSLPELIRWFKELQGAIKGSPKSLVHEMKDVTEQLKELKPTDSRRREQLARKIANLVRRPPYSGRK